MTQFRHNMIKYIILYLDKVYYNELVSVLHMERNENVLLEFNMFIISFYRRLLSMKEYLCIP